MNNKEEKILVGSLCKFKDEIEVDDALKNVYTLLSNNSVYFNRKDNTTNKTCVLMNEKTGDAITVSIEDFEESFRKCDADESLCFIKEVASENYKNYGWRYGQYLFNMAMNYFPVETNQLRGTKYDPFFYDDEDRADEFIEALKALINNDEESLKE